MNKNVLVAVSGGVDSCAAVYLLKEAGYDVTGIMLRLYDKTDENGEILTADRDSAKAVCDSLGVDFVYADYRNEFKNDVIDTFVNEYISGKTPNPCVQCNRTVKFRYVFDYADKNGFDFIATGHYAQVKVNPQTGESELFKALDIKKDQSYVLYNLTSNQLKKLILPLGAYSKPQVREFAKKAGLINYDKADSQDICFIKGDYFDFISNYCRKDFPEGDFIDKDGNVLGRHKGIIRYTVGQRKGLGLSFDSPRYVIRKDISENTVTLGKHEELFSSVVFATDVNIISENQTFPFEGTAMIRYNQTPQPAMIYRLDNGDLKAEFTSPQRAPSPGQSLVIYHGDKVIGGGIIR